MKIEEATEYMSQMYLERILRSYNQDHPKKGENEYRENIKVNVDTIANPELIKERLDNYFFDNRDPYSKQILYSFILQSLLSKTDYYATSEAIIDDVRNTEEDIIKSSTKSESFKHLENDSIKILSAILEVALNDEIISKDELALIVKLRRKLLLNKNDQYLIQAKLNLFPSKGNIIHTRSEISNIIDDLQKCGVIFCCNKHKEIDKTIFVIPEEIVLGVKKALNIELIKDKYELLLNKIQNKLLRRILNTTNLNQGGTKEELIERIIQAGIKPSEALEVLSVIELAHLCDGLPGLTKSGVKQEKIRRITDYFSNLIIKQIESEDPRDKYYEYLEELASQDLKNLLGNKIIKSQKDIERGFEEGTRYLFEKKFNHALIVSNGTENADGGVSFTNSTNVLLWDNKSKYEGSAYSFPDKHFRQFRRYIRNEAAKNGRVNCFLIITAKIDSSAKTNAIRLKAESGDAVDVALITAEDLKMVAENWTNYSNKKSLNLNLFNMTGILNREKLKNRMKIFQSL